MLSFDPSDWTGSVVRALIELHNLVFESAIVDRQGEDIVLEYETGAVIVTTDRERCDLFNQKFQESFAPPPPPPTAEEAAAIMEQCAAFLPDIDWPPDSPPEPMLEKARVAIYFHAQDGVEMDGRRILGLYLVDRAGVELWVKISSRTHHFDDQSWTERVVAAQLLGLIIGDLMKEAGTYGREGSIEHILIAEYTYLIYSEQEMFLSLIKSLVFEP